MLIPLETEQASLLAALCDASRASTERQSFMALNMWQATALKHPGLHGGAVDGVHAPDLEILADQGLVRVASRDDKGRVKTFDVTPAGFAQWEERKAVA